MGTVADAFGAKLPGVRISILSGRGSNDEGFFAGARGVAVSLHPAKLALMRDAQNTSRHPCFWAPFLFVEDAAPRGGGWKSVRW